MSSARRALLKSAHVTQMMAERDLVTCNCFGGKHRQLLRKLTWEFFNERSRGRKNREKAWSEEEMKTENRVPLLTIALLAESCRGPVKY